MEIADAQRWPMMEGTDSGGMGVGSLFFDKNLTDRGSLSRGARLAMLLLN